MAASVGEILRLAREKAGLSQESLAAKAKSLTNSGSKGTVQNYETGKNKPSGATIWAVCKALGFDSYEELKLAALGPGITPQLRGDPDDGIPILADIPASNGLSYEPFERDEGIGDGYVSRSAVGIEDRLAYIVRVRGDSMAPTLAEGDMVICSPSAWREHGFEDGALYAYRLISEYDEETGIKRVRVLEGDEVELCPDNSRHRRRILPHRAFAHAAKAVKRLSDIL